MIKILKRNFGKVTFIAATCIVTLLLLLMQTPSTQAAFNAKNDGNINLTSYNGSAFHLVPGSLSSTTASLIRSEDRAFSPFFSYVHVAGSVLKPRNSNTDWLSDASGGCLYVNGGSDFTIYNIHLDIPDGVRLDYLRIYYYDTDGSNSQAWVTRYDDFGGYEDIAYVPSSGTSGYGTQLSPLISHEVDNVNYSYVLNWRPNVTGSSMQLCGLRVAYRLPLVYNYLPMILK